MLFVYFSSHISLKLLLMFLKQCSDKMFKRIRIMERMVANNVLYILIQLFLLFFNLLLLSNLQYSLLLRNPMPDSFNYHLYFKYNFFSFDHLILLENIYHNQPPITVYIMFKNKNNDTLITIRSIVYLNICKFCRWV